MREIEAQSQQWAHLRREAFDNTSSIAYLDPKEVLGYARHDNPWETVNTNSRAYEKLFGSIKDNGVQEPIDIDTNGASHAVISDGHHRASIAAQLGHAQVPVRITHDPDLDTMDYSDNIMGPGLAKHLGVSPQKSTEIEEFPPAQPWKRRAFEHDMNVPRQERKFDTHAQEARDAGDHEQADYIDGLKEIFRQDVEQGRGEGFSHYAPMIMEEFEGRTAAVEDPLMWRKPSPYENIHVLEGPSWIASVGPDASWSISRGDSTLLKSGYGNNMEDARARVEQHLKRVKAPGFPITAGTFPQEWLYHQ